MTDNEKYNKLYNNLLHSIIKLLNNYQFLGLSQEKIESLIKKFLLDIYNKQDEIKQQNNDYIKKIKSYLDAYVKITIKEPENSLKIINNYINSTLSTNKDSLKELKKISSFLKKYDFIPTPDMYIELTKSNDILNKILKSIVKTNITLITKWEIDSLGLDEISAIFVDVYCTLNNIKIDYQDELLESNEYYTEDSVKSYLKSIPSKILSIEEEQELGIKISQGDLQAKNTLIEHNLRLVVSIAKKHQNKWIDILDLIQEGNLGLIKAVDKYDYQRGLKFSTYATWWIRQTITRAIADKGRTIRIPVHIIDMINKMTSAKGQLTIELNRDPTEEEIAKKMHISLDKLRSIIEYQQDTISISDLVGDEDDTELEKFIPSDDDTPEDISSKSELTEELKNLLKICTKNDRELDIMLLRYGFTGKVYTLEQIGQKYGVTRERIRQIENKILRRLKGPKYQKILLGLQQKEESIHNQSKSKEPSEVIHISIENQVLSSTPQCKPIEIPISGLFEIFTNEGYTKDEIISTIQYLGQEDKKIIELTNGKYLDNPTISENIKLQDKKDYIWITIPRIRTILKSIYGSRNINDLNKQEIVNINPNSTIQNQQNSDKKDKEKNIMTEDLEKKNTSTRSKMTIFQNLGRNGYTKEEILDIIDGLSEDDKKLIYLVNGSDLEQPIKSDLASRKDVTKYYANIIPKIKRKLQNKYGIKSDRMNVETGNNTRTNNDHSNISVVSEEQRKEIPNNSNTKEEYIKILEFLKQPTFKELIANLNPKTAIIVALRLGYIDNKCFSSQSIAEFLGIEESEVIETTIEILKLYKKNIIEIIDKALTYEQSLEYTKNRTNSKK